MINEWDEINDDDYETLPLHHLGDTWSDFKSFIPEEHYKLLTRGLNFILITYPDSLLPTQITELFVDEQVDIPQKKQIVWSLIVDNIMEILVKSGITVSSEYIENKYLYHYLMVLELIFTLPGYEDTLGLSNILDSMDNDPKDRFLLVLEKVHGEGFDSEPYQYFIEDVSEVLLKSLSSGLKKDDELENPPQNIIDRVIDNKPAFKDTLTWDHIVNHGQLGGSVESLLNFFKRDLLRIMEDAGQYEYGRNVICLYFISELNNNKLKEAIARYLDEVVDDITVRMKLDELINSLKIDGVS